MSNAAPPKMLSVREVADRLRLSKVEPILALIHGGHLRAVNISSSPGRPTWRIDPADLERFLEGRRAVPMPSVPRVRRRKPADATPYF